MRKKSGPHAASHFAAIAVACFIALAVSASASAAELLTLDNFSERFSTPALTPVQLPPFDCKPDARNSLAIVCMNNPRYGSVGANIVLRGTKSTREVTYVGVAVGNPRLMEEPHSSALSTFYVLLTSQVMRIVTPELGPERAMKILAALQANSDRNPNEIRVNGWTYGSGTGMLLVFAAERK